MNRNNLIQAHPYSPHPENQINQMNQWFRQTPIGKCQHTGKVNSIDNQPVIHQNP
jgi:predicted esterase